jgi:hypothetical protein|tara:strand:+ start:826 stop:1263 length:438 start_codon:yes stop_codon:yes gene_type:complete
MEQKRVNIQYSVNLEELPNIVAGFLEEIGVYFEAAWGEESPVTSAVIQEINQEKYNNAVERIKRIRTQLANIDYRLADSMSILSGYQQYLSSQNLPQDNEEGMSNEKLDSLREAMKNLPTAGKELVSAVEKMTQQNHDGEQGEQI